VPGTRPADAAEVVGRALREDSGRGDVTTVSVVGPDAACRAEFVAKQDGIVAGIPVTDLVVRTLDGSVARRWTADDGDRIGPGDSLGTLEGPAASILAAERVALNFLCHLSGVATLTARYVAACAGTDATILCTRKTLPGLRGLQRYAVAVGGGRLHRGGLDDGVLIKDNHVALAGGVAEAVRRARDRAPHTIRIEVEVETLEQLDEALEAGADALLLDNATPEILRKAVARAEDSVPLEISGGVTLDSVRTIAEAGPVMISVGRLTHSAPALDVSLDVRPA